MPRARAQTSCSSSCIKTISSVSPCFLPTFLSVPQWVNPWLMCSAMEPWHLAAQSTKDAVELKNKSVSDQATLKKAS